MNRISKLFTLWPAICLLALGLFAAAVPVSLAQDLTKSATLDLPDSPGAVRSSDTGSSSSLASAEGYFDSGPKRTAVMAAPSDRFIAPGQHAPTLRARDKFVMGAKDSITPFSAAAWLTSAGWPHLINGSPNFLVALVVLPTLLGCDVEDDVLFVVLSGFGFCVLSEAADEDVLLNFWATWCAPGRVEMPWFEEFSKTYSNRGLLVLGVSLDDGGWKAVQPVISKLKVTYPIVLGDGKTTKSYGMGDLLPATFLIDRTGKIRMVKVGFGDKVEFEKTIEQLLNER